MAIKQRILVCDCGEQFEEGRDDGTITGNLLPGKWKFTHHSVKAGADDGHDTVVVYFLRSVACGKCSDELFREKRNYDVGANKTRKPGYPAPPNGTAVHQVLKEPEKAEKQAA